MLREAFQAAHLRSHLHVRGLSEEGVPDVGLPRGSTVEQLARGPSSKHKGHDDKSTDIRHLLLYYAKILLYCFTVWF